MSKSVIVIIACLVFAGIVFAQPDMLWERTYGATFTEIWYYWNAKTCAIESYDGGYIAVADTNSADGEDLDCYVVKTDSDGNVEWTRNYGGSYHQVGRSIDMTYDSGYIITGRSSEGLLMLLKIAPDGDSLWMKEYGSVDMVMDGYSVQETTDSGFIVAGFINKYDDDYVDVLLMKMDEHGDSLWLKRFGGDRGDIGFCVQETSDQGFIVAGWNGHTNESSLSIYLLKTDAKGDSIWSKTYQEIDARAHGVDQTSDGGYILTGFDREGGVFLMRTDQNGDSVWYRTYGGGLGYGVQQTFDGGYIAAGMSEVDGGDIFVIRVNASGDSLWTTTYGGEYGDLGYSVRQASDGGFIIAGLSYSFAPFSPDGYQIYLIKTEPDVGITESTDYSSTLLETLPNLIINHTTIKYSLSTPDEVSVSVYNSVGSKVYAVDAKYQEAGSYALRWDTNNLPAGLYFIELRVGAQRKTAKVIIVK